MGSRSSSTTSRSRSRRGGSGHSRTSRSGSTPGDVVSLTGPSGGGKSTLLNLIGALDRPDAGSIVVGGERLEELADPSEHRPTPGCRRSWTGSGSCVSRTSTSACRRRRSALPGRRPRGRGSASPTSLRSAATSLARPRGEPRCGELGGSLPPVGVRRARQPRQRPQARPAGAPVTTCRSSSRRRCSARRRSAARAARRPVWIAGVDARLFVRGRSRLDPTASRAADGTATSGSCSATTRACSTRSSRATSSSCSPDTCTAARSRSRSGREDPSRAPGRPVHRGRLREQRHDDARLCGVGTTFVPFRLLARPEATELVLRAAVG